MKGKLWIIKKTSTDDDDEVQIAFSSYILASKWLNQILKHTKDQGGYYTKLDKDSYRLEPQDITITLTWIRIFE